ncbi:MAG: hypothetical protein EPO65_10650 [Dehalococcoidia bacterium]|nr:MAG: hypothetical protein EPO65_10650 [Dehalococcoidia bacterium]
MPDLWLDQHPLDSPLWKIRWAKNHVEVIDRAIRLWHALDENNVAANLNADQTLWEYRVGAVRPPPLDISLEAGGFAYQLRSALDQIVYGLSVFPNGLSDRDRESAEGSTAFPILRAANDDAIWGRLRFVPEEIRGRVWEAINQVQPYQAGDLYRDELMLLDRINIRDKHRLLEPAGGNLDILDVPLKPGMWIAHGHLKNGDVFFRVPADLDPEVELHNHFSRSISLRIPGPVGDIPIWRLRDIYRRVAFEVLPLFYPLCNPLPKGQRIPDSIPDFVI